MNDWILHDGKGMPIASDTLVYVRFGDGAENDEPQPASIAGDCWGLKSGHYAIVAYRVHEQSEQVGA